MKIILVPTDFSDLAKNALKFAVKIAHATKSKIIIMHSVHPMFIATDADMFGYPDVFEEETTEALQKQMDELVAFVSEHGVDAEKLMIKGLLGDNISSLVEENNIDLVVTGTNGAKGLEAFLLGTNSVTLLEKLTCPVLIIPADAKYHSIKKIMYATDFQYGDVRELAEICELAQAFNAEVTVTHVNTDLSNVTKDSEDMDWFSEIGDSMITYKNIRYKLIYDQDVIEALEKEIKESGTDILCMSTVEKDFFKKLVSKSNTKEMAFHTKIPLMTLHLSKENKLK